MAKTIPSTPLFSAGYEIASFIVSSGLLSKAWEASILPYKNLSASFIVDEDEDGNVYFAFPSSPRLEDLITPDGRYGLCEIQNENVFFSSLKGSDDLPAHVHQGALRWFLRILQNSDLKVKFNAAQEKRKNIIFVGHSLGGAIATLATLFILEERQGRSPPFCITFGCPLVGDARLVQAVVRENWGGQFCHVVSKHDIIPRILLAPFESIREPLLAMFPQLWSAMTKNSSIAPFNNGSFPFIENASRILLTNVCDYASSLIGCGGTSIAGAHDIIERSPYRPFGTYTFCSNIGAACIENPETVLQMLYFTLQVQDEISVACISEHIGYGAMLQNINESLINTRTGANYNLDSSYDVQIAIQLEAIGIAGQNVPALLALHSAGENENKLNTCITKVTLDLSRAQSAMAEIEWYKRCCVENGIGYYDSFKMQTDKMDIRANLCRHKLKNFWDDIIEKVEKRELPSGFQSQNKWINAGTAYRRLVEPLDIAHYYRTNKGTKSYLLNGRPQRHRILQKWMEEKEKTRNSRGKQTCTKPASVTLDSCFWAHLEEAWQLVMNLKQEQHQVAITQLKKFEDYVMRMLDDHSLSAEVFLGQSSFIKWWQDYKQSPACNSSSSLYKFMENEAWKSY